MFTPIISFLGEIINDRDNTFIHKKKETKLNHTNTLVHHKKTIQKG